MKKRKRMGERGDPWGIPVSIGNQSLSYPQKDSLVRRPWRKASMYRSTHGGKPFVRRTQRSLSWETLGKARLMLRLSMVTMQPWWAFHAVWTHEVSKLIAARVEHLFCMPIWFQGRRLCSSAVAVMWSATIFSTSFASEFSSEIGL